MKKLKKISALFATVSMTLLTTINAFAFDTLTFVGNPNLFGKQDNSANQKNTGWIPTAEDQIMELSDKLPGIYVYSSEYVLNDDYNSLSDEEKAEKTQFKIIADGKVSNWYNQLSLGENYSVWGDDRTQFCATNLDEGKFNVYVNPDKGYVCVLQYGRPVTLTVRYRTTSFDSTNFVNLDANAIMTEGYSDVSFDKKD